MTIVYILLGLLALAIVVILALAASKPADFRIERNRLIEAPAERIFAEVADLGRWANWSPWEKKDPNMKREMSAVTAGQGATYEWWGNKDVGHGKMTVLEATPHSRVRIGLHFIDPFEAQNEAEFTFTSEGGATRVNWAMTGKSNLMGRVMCLFMDMEKMVGPDFEAGLNSLKTNAEKAA